MSPVEQYYMDVMSAQQDGFVTFAKTKVRKYIKKEEISFIKTVNTLSEIEINFLFISISSNLLLKDQK